MSTETERDAEIPGDLPSESRWRWRRYLWPALIVCGVLIVLWYPIGMLWVHTIDDDGNFALADTDLPQGGSRAVAMAAALIDREVNQHRWVAADPFFLPGAMLDNMPNFQQGIMSSLGRFAFELTDQIGRTRGSSRADPELQEAAGLLQYPGNRWVMNFSITQMITATSASQYRQARKALVSYNRRLADHQATFERRSDNLQATLDRIAADLGSASAVLDAHVTEASQTWVDWHADDVFYSVKGQAYAYYLILRELGKDYDSVLKERTLDATWQQMLDSLRRAATLRPWIVSNGAPDSAILPNHLAAEGFYLLRARTQLREATSILQK
jgi:hypothetical protein